MCPVGQANRIFSSKLAASANQNSNRRQTKSRFDNLAAAAKLDAAARSAAAVRSEAEDEWPKAASNPSGRTIKSKS